MAWKDQFMLTVWPQVVDDLLEDMGVRAMRSGGSWLSWPFKVVDLDEISNLKAERDHANQRRKICAWNACFWFWLDLEDVFMLNCEQDVFLWIGLARVGLSLLERLRSPTESRKGRPTTRPGYDQDTKLPLCLSLSGYSFITSPSKPLALCSHSNIAPRTAFHKLGLYLGWY